MLEREEESGAARDLEERFAFLARNHGIVRARFDYWRQVLAAVPGFLRNRLYWSQQMLKHYLKIALRVLRKHKGYSAINIAGLAVGMACALLILLWVQYERSYDGFHAGAETLFRVEQDQHTPDGGVFHVPVTPCGMAAELQAQIPEIKETARRAYTGTLVVRHGEKVFYEDFVRAVDPAFLRMFTFPAVKGDRETALDDPSSIALTETMAVKYFGAENPLGQTVTINNSYSAMVTTVLKDPPLNSLLRFDALLPMAFLKAMGQDIDEWGGNSIFTYVRLNRPNAVAATNDKISRLARERRIAALRSNPEIWGKIQSDPQEKRRFETYRWPDFTLKPVAGLKSEQMAETIAPFVAIALIVLLIACINFMNLATARSANRAREVGLRKVAGAFWKTIAGQFYGEAVLTAILSGLAAIALVLLVLPLFGALLEENIPAASLLNGKFLLGILAVTAFTGFVAGSYPALFLSSFQPAEVLKGRLARVRGAGFRKSLVVIQFGLSIFLLIGTGVVSRQVNFMRTKTLGYEKDQLIYLPLRSDTSKTYPVLKERFLQDPRILKVTGTAQTPTVFGANGWGAAWEGKRADQNVLIGMGWADFDFTETMNISLVAGRAFDKKIASDKGRAFLVNEEIPKLMGLDAASAVGKRFSHWQIEGTIVGVMKNYHFQSIRYAIDPLAVVVDPDKVDFAVIRLKAGDVAGSLEAVHAAWHAVNPSFPLEYRFFDQDFDEMYRADERMEKVHQIFAAMAVMIACLGLFGLASFMAEQRTREIGIRKVLGASARSVVVLLSREFAKWVLLANLIAWPAAYFYARSWLQGYAYRTGIAWWLFVLSGAGTLLIALLSVSFQSLRAAQYEPAKALKYE